MLAFGPQGLHQAMDDGCALQSGWCAQKPFCDACDRVRLTADGSIRNCLFSEREFPIRDRLRDGIDDDALVEQFRLAIAAKKAGHGIDGDSFSPPDRPMYSIGG